MGFIDFIKAKWKHPDFIGKTTCFVLLLSTMTLLTWADIYDKIDKLSVKCQAGDKKACAKLAEIAMKNKGWMVRKAAVKELTDQSVLAGIAKNDDWWLVRLDAADKLDDKALAQTVYLAIARNYEESFVFRMEGVVRLTDQTLLVEIARNDEDYNIRAAAVNKLTDQAVLVEIAKNEKNEWVLEQVAYKLNDRFLAQAIYAYLAINAKDWRSRTRAVENLTNQDLLETVVKYDLDEHVREAAKESLRKLKNK